MFRKVGQGERELFAGGNNNLTWAGWGASSLRLPNLAALERTVRSRYPPLRLCGRRTHTHQGMDMATVAGLGLLLGMGLALGVGNGRVLATPR